MAFFFMETKLARGVTAMVAVAVLAACGEHGNGAIQGYAEGEYVRVAAPFTGSLQQHKIRASESNAGAARAALAQADWRLAQKSVPAPVTGLANDTNYVVGEWASTRAR